MRADQLLDKALSEFREDPLGYVMFAFPWDSDPSIQVVKLQSPYKERFGCEYGPDVWACEFLDDLAEEIKKRGFTGEGSVPPIQFSTASGHGIGKSTLCAWLIKFILDTRPYSKGTVTANTAEQLKVKTWAELGKWHKISLTEHWFTYNSGRGAMSLFHNEFKERWRVDAQTCREENSESFAGQHAAGSTSFYIFDEASAVPDKIFEVREGGTVLGEPMTFDFGNPTRNSGMFFENCIGKFRHRYKVRSIDSRDVTITNKDRMQDWIDDYGEDSDFIKVRVKGQFPSVGSVQFISSDLVEEAMRREVPTDKSSPLIIGVDIARFGNNDTVIYPRIGYDASSFPFRRFNGLDTVQVVGQIIEMLREFRALDKHCSALFIDGGGIGGGVVDQLYHLGYSPIEVQFGSNPVDRNTYRYKGDEMWGKMKDSMHRLALPNNPDLRAQLTQREYGYTLGSSRLHLETKKDMEKRGCLSPDVADALALTFAQDVAEMVGIKNQYTVPMFSKHEYDPLKHIQKEGNINGNN